MRHGVAVVALLASASSALGIVVVDSSQYIARPKKAYVGQLGGGSCVPIGARYALTADHVGVGGKAKIVMNGVVYSVKRTFSHPNAPGVDMKIVEISGPPFFSDWVRLHQAPTTIPLGSTVYIGGTGYEAAGASGQCIAWGGRAEHWATNQIEGFIGTTVPYAWYRFDKEIPNEGIASLYDSGSPMFFMGPDDCRVYLLGIATSASTASGPTCDGHSAYYVVADSWVRSFAQPVCAGDLDRDGDTDLFDFMTLINLVNSGGPDCADRADGDLNWDGRVDIADFSILSQDYGCTP